MTDADYRILPTGDVAFVYRLPEPDVATFKPGTVTVTDTEIIIAGWTATDADMNALGVHAIEWAMDLLADALP